jgi:enediyne biosynthesis protein E4
MAACGSSHLPTVSSHGGCGSSHRARSPKALRIGLNSSRGLDRTIAMKEMPMRLTTCPSVHTHDPGKRSRASGGPVRISPERVLSTALLCPLLLLGFLQPVFAQTFTRITTGPAVTDGGGSRAVVWADYDFDDDLDLYVSNGPDPGEPAFLYSNDGAPDWTFTKVKGQPIVQDPARADGASFGDCDNDGDLDAVVVTWYGDVNLFYRGDGPGAFTRDLDDPIGNIGTYSESCSWGDYDGDHALDLYVANSGNATAVPNLLYHNEGAGSFTQVTIAPVTTDARRTRGVNWVDYDNDGDFDLLAVNESNQHENLYRNDGGGVFSAVAGDPLVSSAGSSWTASWADLDDDGDLDVYVGNSGNQNDLLFKNDGDGTFTPIAGDPVVTSAGWTACSGWGDYDNDGDLDLFTSNAFGTTAKQNFLFTNRLRETGTLSFVRVLGVPLVTDLGWTYGFAWGDYDRDGDLDIFQARTFNDDEDNALYRNDNANGNHWLTCRLVGMVSNRSAIGARVKVEANLNGNAVTQTRVVEGQSGYCGQNLELHFGLADAAVISQIVVEWPSGLVDVLTGVTADQHLVLVEGSTTSVEPGDLDPRGTLQIIPNPFREETELVFSLERAADVRLDLFDPSGRRIARLIDQSLAAGSHATRFAPSDESGSGIFFYRLSRDQEVSSGRLVRR